MLLNKFILFFIYLYQKLPFRSATNCRFYPTCSNYGKDVFLKHNFFCAVNLLIKRIGKCHPFTEQKVDTPPLKGCGHCICKVK